MTPATRYAPRIELHCHLDCCVGLDTLRELSARRGIEHDRPLRELAIAPARPTSLAEYLVAVEVALPVMQSAEELTRVAAELVDGWAGDGVIHGEARFAPQLHRREGLTLDEIVDAVMDGLEAGSTGRSISTSLIVCCLRHQDPTVSQEVAQLAVRRRDVVDGLDLAGPEQGNPGHPHRTAFRHAREAGVPITVHAGEAAGPESVREALDELGARRIGHGVRSVEDADLVVELADRRITLECCPTSNVQTGATASIDEHPIDALRRAGVPVTVSTDGRTTSDTDLGRELAAVAQRFDWGASVLRDLQRCAADAAFVTPRRRAELRAALDR